MDIAESIPTIRDTLGGATSNLDSDLLESIDKNA